MEPRTPPQHPVLSPLEHAGKRCLVLASCPAAREPDGAGGTAMDVIYPRCAAIDVHKRTAVASVGWVDEQGRRQRQTRTFSTMTADLEGLRDWLVEQRVTHVAMESTGVFWKPLFNVLEEQLTVVLANAAH